MTATPTSATQAETHRPPRLLAVALVQLRAVAESLRWEFLAALLLMVGTTVLMVFYALRMQSRIDFDIIGMAVPALIAGLLAPLAVWKREAPSHRTYLWTMPVDRARLTLLKAFSGWVWLMALVAVYLLWALAITLGTGGDIGVHVIMQSMQESLPAGTPIQDLSLHGRPWMWLVPFTGATVAYLFASILVVVTDHPWLWGAGIWFAWMLPAALATEANVGWLSWFGTVAFGQCGVVTALSGLTEVIDPVNPQDIDLGLVVGTVWVGATLLWLALGLTGTLVAAHRYQER